MATEQMVFKISWREKKQARLAYLIDNGKIILDLGNPADDRVGTGEIEHTYEVPASPIHRVRWLLWFPNETLTELVAKGRRVAEPGFQPLDQADDCKNRWEETGAL